MPLLVANSATESYDALTLRECVPQERFVEPEFTLGQWDWSRNEEANGVDAPPEQEWLGLLMEELNAQG